MISHEYQVTQRDWIRCFAPTIVVFALVVAMLHLSRVLGWLPLPPVSEDPDTTVLGHQALASRSCHRAEIVLLGDSTCLMGVDALQLSRGLPGSPRVFSLALFLWLDFNVYADALSDFVAANPGAVRAVILLVSPAKLAQPSPSNSNLLKEWRVMREGYRRTALDRDTHAWRDWLGVRLARQRLASHLLNQPLRGSGAAFYGFSSEIDAYMTRHEGSGVDYGTTLARPRSRPQTLLSVEWPLAPELESETRAFRSRIPPGVKLWIGLTPSPKQDSAADARRERDDLLRRWNSWLQADALLTNLPATLPDPFFSRTAHLNEAGQKRFTAAVRKEVSALLTQQSGSPTRK